MQYIEEDTTTIGSSINRCIAGSRHIVGEQIAAIYIGIYSYNNNNSTSSDSNISPRGGGDSSNNNKVGILVEKEIKKFII